MVTGRYVGVWANEPAGKPDSVTGGFVTCAFVPDTRSDLGFYRWRALVSTGGLRPSWGLLGDFSGTNHQHADYISGTQRQHAE